MTRGFLISEGLHRDIKRTIARVDGIPEGPGATRIPTRFENLPLGGEEAEKTFRICTFTGSWSKSADKVVTFRGVTTTPNTVSATNLFATIATGTTAARNCAIAKDGTAWYLIAAEC